MKLYTVFFAACNIIRCQYSYYAMLCKNILTESKEIHAIDEECRVIKLISHNSLKICDCRIFQTQGEIWFEFIS